MQCVLSYMDEALTEPVQFIGEVQGSFSFDRYEQGGENPKLPFELIFVPNSFDKPAAFDQEAWLTVGHHRIQAAKKLADWLRDNRK